MPRQVVRVRGAGPTPAEPATPGADPRRLGEGIDRLRGELDLPADFPPEVAAAAADAARSPRLPDLDRTDLPLVTLDPPGARDLDQALAIAREGDGYVVHYAIADVAAFVSAGDPVDQEARRRGETLYAPDSRIPLHPPALSEDAASLLAGRTRPALLWTFRLDRVGEVVDVRVERAQVRSRGQYDYAAVQVALDAGEGDVLADGVFALLLEVGRLRRDLEAARGGISLALPDQEVECGPEGWRLRFRRQSEIEECNAQISLMTGMAAADLMVYARIGVLRTLPPVDSSALRELRRSAASLGVDWPVEQLVGDFLRALDPGRAAHAAVLLAATRLLRGAGYVAFDGELPELVTHAGLASEYAHCTAPLRRLVDRFTGEVCVALSAGREVPEWVREALPDLPRLMAESSRRASAYERGVVDLVEALLLEDAVGREFPGVVLTVRDSDPSVGTIQLDEPAVEAPLRGAGGAALTAGRRVVARLAEVDVEQRRVRFEVDPA